MRFHCFQHIPIEGLGMMEPWILAQGHTLSYTHFYQPDAALPKHDQYDFLVIMGGSMGVYDDSLYPWLKGEIEFIKEAISQKKIVLGICLGSQLMAAALGAQVFPSGLKEIGWYPITFSTKAQDLPWFTLAKKDQFVFHWHGDTFDLPPGAHLLASSVKIPHQAFLWGDRVLGLQFHLEVDVQQVEVFLKSGMEELKASKDVQTPSEMISLSHHSQETREHLMGILEHLTSITG